MELSHHSPCNLHPFFSGLLSIAWGDFSTLDRSAVCKTPHTKSVHSISELSHNHLVPPNYDRIDCSFLFLSASLILCPIHGLFEVLHVSHLVPMIISHPIWPLAFPLSPAQEASTCLLVIYPSHVTLLSLLHTHTRQILTLLRMCWMCDSPLRILFIALSASVVCFLELLSLQSGSINSAEWIRSSSSSSSCLRSSLAGSLAQWVCILNAPLASMREMIGRINCGCRVEWE